MHALCEQSRKVLIFLIIAYSPEGILIAVTDEPPERLSAH